MEYLIAKLMSNFSQNLRFHFQDKFVSYLRKCLLVCVCVGEGEGDCAGIEKWAYFLIYMYINAL